MVTEPTAAPLSDPLVENLLEYAEQLRSGMGCDPDAADDLEAAAAALAQRDGIPRDDARDAARFRYLREITIDEWDRLAHYTQDALSEQIDDRLAVEGERG